MTQKPIQADQRTSLQPAIPLLPPWPTSSPGPKVTAPPPGTKRLHLRSEQVTEVDYDQLLGKSTIRSGEERK